MRNLNDSAKKLVTDKFANYQGPYTEDISKVIEFMNQGQSQSTAKLVEVLRNSDIQRNQKFSDHHPEMAKAIGYE